ncbi:hypothetical protein ACJX0J_037658, partial [Zea mays]
MCLLALAFFLKAFADMVSIELLNIIIIILKEIDEIEIQRRRIDWCHKSTRFFTLASLPKSYFLSGYLFQNLELFFVSPTGVLF